ncbi:MAG: hypothetical protein C0485_19500 [Pirellula sp.]|nr:hypothetical protein [Pirellula sp.]
MFSKWRDRPWSVRAPILGGGTMFNPRISRKWIGTLCLGATSGLMSAPALAQSTLEKPPGQAAAERVKSATPGTANRRTAQPAGAATNQGGQQAGNLNNEIAVWLVLGNQEEVALAQFAEQRSQNPEVKRFAQQMIEHHQQTLAKIEQAAPETAGWNLQLRTGETDRNASSPQASGVQQASAEVELAANDAAGHHQSVQLAQQIKQECLNLTEQELSQQQGTDFDKAYIGQQVGAHIGMLAQLRGSKHFANGPLQQVIVEGERMTQQHLSEAKQIMSQLKDQQSSPPAPTSQRPAATQRPEQ